MDEMTIPELQAYSSVDIDLVWHLSNLVTFIRLNLFAKTDRAGDPVDEMAQQSVLQANQNARKRTAAYRLWIKWAA